MFMNPHGSAKDAEEVNPSTMKMGAAKAPIGSKQGRSALWFKAR